MSRTLAKRKYKMETSLEERLHKTQQSERVWKIIAAAACIVAVVTSVMLAKQAPEEKNVKETPSSNTAPETEPPIWFTPCPKRPLVLPLPADPPPQAISDELRKLESFLESVVDTDASLPGISANIIYRGSVLWSGHYGSKQYKQPAATPDGNTHYRIGSVTKIFTVLMVYKMYEDKLIESLDDPLSKYNPDFQIQNPYTKDVITIRQMVNQMSGLPREAPCQFSCTGTSSAEQLALIRNTSLVASPWTKPSYSNLAFSLLARLLSERLLNQTFERWVTERILEPLGMEDTGFAIAEHVLQNMALPYGRNGKRMPFKELGWNNPAGNMYSSLNDLTKLALMFTQPEKQDLFKPASLREMMLPTDIAPDGRTVWGSPWEMLLIKGFLVRGKAGNLDSYNTYVSYVPELQLGMNVMVSTGEYAKQGGPLAAVVATDTTLQTLLPSLATTLLELEAAARFPVDPKPYTGSFHMKGKHPLLETKYSYVVTVSVHTMFLVIRSAIRSNTFYEVTYIGDPLAFKAKDATLPPTCFFQRSGIYGNLRFDPPDKDGLSPGFVMPDWNIVASRRSGVQVDGDVANSYAVWSPHKWLKTCHTT